MGGLASRLQILDGLGEAALGAGGGVGVDDVLGSSLVELLGGRLKCDGAGLDVALGYGSADLADGRADRRADRTVVLTTNLALTKAFLGTGGIWHFSLAVGFRETLKLIAWVSVSPSPLWGEAR